MTKHYKKAGIEQRTRGYKEYIKLCALGKLACILNFDEVKKECIKISINTVITLHILEKLIY